MFRIVPITVLLLLAMCARTEAGMWLGDSDQRTSLSAEAMVQMVLDTKDDSTPSVSRFDGNINWAVLDATQSYSQTAISSRGELEWGPERLGSLSIAFEFLPPSPILDGLLKPA